MFLWRDATERWRHYFLIWEIPVGTPSAFLDIEICHRGGRRDRISVVGRMLGVKGAHHRAPHVALHVTILFLYYFLLFFTTINIPCAAMC